MTVSVYIQAGNQPFLSFDDPSYIINNHHISSGITGENIAWAFSSIEYANWHPVTWLSHMLDVQIYGLNPRGHHLTNVIIHTVTTLLLFFFLRRITGSLWHSAFVAALFSLHPLHVESVAWVAERKDVLSAFFCFAALFFYSEYVSKHTPGMYLASLLSFILGLMSKPMLVSIPLVMLMIDYWPLGRFEQGEQRPGKQSARIIALIKEKIPFFICSLISGFVTIYAQSEGGAIPGFESLPLFSRVGNAMTAYVKYIGKTLWPKDLAILYPLTASLSSWEIACALSLLLIISGAVIFARQRFPYLLVGWLWFIVTLLPVIGIIQVGNQSMADRYTYIPITGLFIMVAWGVTALSERFAIRGSMLALPAGAVIVAAAMVTWQQLGYWQDNISLYRHSIQVAPGSYTVHNNLGRELEEQGELEAAIEEYRKAIQISPNCMDAYNNLGIALVTKGDLDAAIMEFQNALRISPNDIDAHYNLGATHARKGALDAAILEFQTVLRINPDHTMAKNNLDLALGKKR